MFQSHLCKNNHPPKSLYGNFGTTRVICVLASPCRHSTPSVIRNSRLPHFAFRGLFELQYPGLSSLASSTPGSSLGPPPWWITAPGGGGGTPIHYLYGYVPPNGVVILKLLIKNGVSISEAFSRTGYKKLSITALCSA